MFRRLAIQLRTLAPPRSASKTAQFAVGASRPSENAIRSIPVYCRHFSTESGNVPKKVEDVMPIATGHEREELEAELEGRDILEINHPCGPFGTKEEPAMIKSYYDKRIVGCPGGEGEDEHDVVWFWLEKGKPHECPVCSQYFVFLDALKNISRDTVGSENFCIDICYGEFKRHCCTSYLLEVVGPGGPPDGHGDDEDDHHH